jgi:hypothetical protein
MSAMAGTGSMLVVLVVPMVATTAMGMFRTVDAQYGDIITSGEPFLTNP